MIDLDDIDIRISELEHLNKNAAEQGDTYTVELFTDLIRAYKTVKEIEEVL